MSIIIAILIIISSSLIIYISGNKFAEASSNIGQYLNLPKDIKGATFDAVASSLPELLVSLYSVIFFKKFEVGIGTIAGSALFNLLVIPGICVLISPIAFKVSKKVLSRDALYYMLAVFTLTVLLIYFKSWGISIALILLFLYFLYIKQISNDAKKEKNQKSKKEKINIKKEILIFLISMIIIGFFTFFLTDSSIYLAEQFKIPPIIIAFTIIAAATSLPDTVISAINAKKGNIDDATSNVFGSNIFDIFVGIGLPLLIYSLYKTAAIIKFSNLEIVLGLLCATILLLIFFADNRQLNKKQAKTLILMYILFIFYTIYITLF